MADIECMYYQVRFPPHDSDVLRFLWWPGNNLENQSVPDGNSFIFFVPYVNHDVPTGQVIRIFSLSRAFIHFSLATVSLFSNSERTSSSKLYCVHV